MTVLQPFLQFSLNIYMLLLLLFPEEPQILYIAKKRKKLWYQKQFAIVADDAREPSVSQFYVNHSLCSCKILWLLNLVTVSSSQS